MDFFAYQQQARRYSALLLVLFTLAVLGLVLALNLLVGWLVVLGHPRDDYRHLADLPPVIYGWTTAITLAMIGAGTLRRLWELSAGGPVVARLAGARWVAPDASDAPRRRLLNVAEEIAVASGLAMPRIYLMQDEPGINAFAAGRGPADAVIAVTRGCLERLDRDQLQGVLAHEFSHLLHGDGRLNIRLLGLLHGLTAPGALGLWLLHSATPSLSSRGRLARGGFPGQLLAGGLLAAIGYLGVLLARLIRAAVSRQREFLADAAAVQFTRQPRGLAGALRRIRDEAAGPALRTAQAEALSHMLFAGAAHGWFGRLLASHPPLDARIARIYPAFVRPATRRAAPRDVTSTAAAPPVAPAEPYAVRMDQIAGCVGRFDAVGLGYAAGLLQGIPAPLREATRTAAGAGALLGGLLAAPGAQLAAFSGALGAAAAPFAHQFGQAVQQLGPQVRLPLIDLALPALQAQPPAWRADLLDALHALAADRPDAWPALALLRHHLAPARRGRGGAAAGPDDIRQVLRTLADCAGTGAADAYAVACGTLGLPALAVTADRVAFEAALQRLAGAPLTQRLGLLAAGAVAVGHDGVVELDELEMLRLIGAALDCPLPPLAGKTA
jgi:Zn-dependent protease with chaperone function